RLANIAVVHAEDQETAGALAARLRQTLNIQELILADLSVVVAAHLGPGTVGIVAYPVGSVE
ncbi:MAG: DegV family protein, partial [Anaerolineaceae bacterium]|nr:DegV family protein [Anaerolineaceae bacterium]